MSLTEQEFFEHKNYSRLFRSLGTKKQSIFVEWMDVKKPDFQAISTLPYCEKKLSALLSRHGSYVTNSFSMMAINGEIFPNKKATEWLMATGKERCKELFGCYPLDEIPNIVSPLRNLRWYPFLLYSHLSTLIQKKAFSVEKTNKVIKNQFKNRNIENSYTILTDYGLLRKVSEGIWEHDDTVFSKEAREQMKHAVVTGAFLQNIERQTLLEKKKIEFAKKFGCQIISEYIAPTICPSCYDLPKEKIAIPLVNLISGPFHYFCNRMSMIDEEAVDIFTRTKMDETTGEPVRCPNIDWEGITYLHSDEDTMCYIPFENIATIKRIDESEIYYLDFRLKLKNGQSNIITFPHDSKFFDKITAFDVKEMFFE